MKHTNQLHSIKFVPNHDPTEWFDISMEAKIDKINLLELLKGKQRNFNEIIDTHKEHHSSFSSIYSASNKSFKLNKGNSFFKHSIN